MALPLPRVVADIEPGGRIVSALNSMNALANNMNLEKLSRAKAQYAKETALADIMSKIAYSNLVGLQPIGKILGNENAFLSLPDAEKQAIVQRFQKAGMGGAANSLNQMLQTPNTANSGSTQETFPEWIKNAFKGMIVGGRKPEVNPTNAFSTPQVSSFPPRNSLQNPVDTQESRNNVQPEANFPDDNEEDRYYKEWFKTPEGIVELEKGEAGNFPSGEEIIKWGRSRNVAAPKSFAETVGSQKGIINEGEKLGGLRGEAVNQIGLEQQSFAKSGDVINELINDFTSPEFVALRNEFPYLQNMQLEAASHLEDPRVQAMVGKIIGDLESFKAATISGFKGQTLKREFDFADKIKPSQNDTVYTALGKMEALKNLHDIAEKKNSLISSYLQKEHLNLPEAIEKANKAVNVKDIREKVKELTEPLHEFKNNKTGVTIYLTLQRAKELGLRR